MDSKRRQTDGIIKLYLPSFTIANKRNWAWRKITFSLFSICSGYLYEWVAISYIFPNNFIFHIATVLSIHQSYSAQRMKRIQNYEIRYLKVNKKNLTQTVLKDCKFSQWWIAFASKNYKKINAKYELLFYKMISFVLMPKTFNFSYIFEVGVRNWLQTFRKNMVISCW